MSTCLQGAAVVGLEDQKMPPKVSAMPPLVGRSRVGGRGPRWALVLIAALGQALTRSRAGVSAKAASVVVISRSQGPHQHPQQLGQHRERWQNQLSTTQTWKTHQQVSKPSKTKISTRSRALHQHSALPTIRPTLPQSASRDTGGSITSKHGLNKQKNFGRVWWGGGSQLILLKDHSKPFYSLDIKN